MRYCYVSILGLCLAASSVSGQNWQSYTNFNPVSQLSADGPVLWAASPGGCYSFSLTGAALVRHYTNVDGLPHIVVTSVAVDDRHRKYFGTVAGGVAVLDSAGSGWDVINVRSDNIISDSITAVLASGDRIFLGSPGGLSFFDGQAWQTFSSRQFPIGGAIQALGVRRDSLWICTSRGLTVSPLQGLVDRNPSLWARYTSLGVSDSSVHCLLLDDTLTVIGTGKGMSRLFGTVWQFMPGLSAEVRTILRDGDTLCLATAAGAWKYANGSAVGLPGLPSPDVTSLYMNSIDTVWAGTALGLARWAGGSWQSFPFPCLPASQVNKVAVSPDGSIWLAHGYAFASRILSDGSIKAYQHPIPTSPVTALEVDQDGNAWYGLGWGDASGRSCIVINPQDDDSIIGMPILPPMCGVYDIYNDNQNRLYFAMRYHNVPNYIVELSPSGQFEWINDPNPPGTYLKPMAVAKDSKGALWVGSFELGLFRYDFSDGTWMNFRTADGLSSEQIVDIAIEPSDVLWLSTNGGLTRCLYDNSLQRLSDLVVFRTTTGQIAGDDVRAVAVDHAGNRWIATDRGLSLLTWDGRWQRFTSGDDAGNGSKLLDDDVRDVAVLSRDQTGDDILIATARGLSRYLFDRSQEPQSQTVFVAPNPFRPAADRQLLFSNLPDRATVRIYALDGRLLATLQGPLAPAHTLLVDATVSFSGGLPSGLYLCHVTSAAAKPQTCKLVVVR